MSIEDYFDNVRNTLKENSPFISSELLTFDVRYSNLGKIKGHLDFIDFSRLYLLEIIDTHQIPKVRYSYHYQNASGKLVFRYDNAPHHRKIKTFPHHKHIEEQKVILSREPSLNNILREIIAFVSRRL